MASVAAQATQMNTAAANINDMRMSLPSGEQGLAQSVVEEYQFISAYVLGLQTIGLLAGKMKSPDDAKSARAAFTNFALGTVLQLDVTITGTNRNLGYITRAAVLAEATKVPDAMVAVRDLLKSYTHNN